MIIDKGSSINIGKATTKAVTGVTIDHNTLEMNAGDEGILRAIVSPEDATNKNILWTTSDDSIVIVGQDGTVNAISGGNATITVTTEDGNLQATCAISVSKTNEKIKIKVLSNSCESGTATPESEWVVKATTMRGDENANERIYCYVRYPYFDDSEYHYLASYAGTGNYSSRMEWYY